MLMGVFFMKNTKKGKITFFCAIMFLCAGPAVFSQNPSSPSLDSLQDAAHSFSTNLALSLPFNANMGLNWSDAHIGKFPHFGVGVSGGFSTMNIGIFKEMFNKFDLNLPDILFKFAGLPIPGYTVEGRISGFSLPFDIGVKFGYLPMSPGSFEKFDYLLAGGDIRYAVLKGSAVVPTISIGMGYNYMSGALGIKAEKDAFFNYTDLNGNNQTLTLTAPVITLPWSTSALDFKVQISKSTEAVTPYLGVGASFGFSKAGYRVESAITDSGAALETAKSFFKEEFGINDISSTGFESIASINKWSGRLYGGLSFNITIVKIDLTGLWNFVDNSYGVSLGIRVQT